MEWKLTPKVKVYEAMGCVADSRVELVGDGAKVYSSSRGKYYTVNYDPKTKAIMLNDNASYWVGYLGYPAVAFLLAARELDFDRGAADILKGIPWKEINKKHQDDFEEALEEIKNDIIKNGGNWNRVAAAASHIYEQLQQRSYHHLGSRMKPPAGY